MTDNATLAVTIADGASAERVHEALTATHAAHAGIDGIIFASTAWLIRAMRPAEETP